MVLIKCPGDNGNHYDIIFQDEFIEAHDTIAPIKLDQYTKDYESKGIWMIDEEKVAEKCIIRRFASQSNGYEFDLILCDGIANNINQINS